MPDRSVNIIIIGYHLSKIESSCIKSILYNTKYRPYIITYFDNYASGMSLTRVWNKLIAASTCEFICLLNSDTIVYPNWLHNLMKTFSLNERIKFVGPSTNQCHSIQKQINSFEESKKHINEVEFLEDPISGFCVVFPKEIWNELKGFDERYNFYGAESDFIDRAKKANGYICAWRKDSFVYHIGAASIKAHKKDEDIERSRAKKLYWENRKL